MECTVSVEVGAVHDHLLNTPLGDVVRVGPGEVSSPENRATTHYIRVFTNLL
jgi:hypothetical protein